MKLATFSVDGPTRVGIVVQDGIVDVSRHAAGAPTDMIELIASAFADLGFDVDIGPSDDRSGIGANSLPGASDGGSTLGRAWRMRSSSECIARTVTKRDCRSLARA